jgi:zinc protease
MIHYEHFTLDNGLQVYVHEDKTTPMAVLNILYNVGSRDEKQTQTGFAHLFEHLMFGGSQNIESYDEPLQKVGGENNAFTSPDITNYYITLPADNLETAFWLESDRMLSLSFSPKVLEVQQKVVIEEFNQRYLNQPYGDVWLHLRPLAYTKHPYQWPTIGKEISHIADAKLEDVKDFFYKYYRPNNAIMVIGGNVSLEKARELSQKWFGPIPAGEAYQRNLPQEPVQTEKRTLTLEREVPLDALYKVFHVPGRMHDDYYTCDLISDILGRGKSSRLYNQLVKGKKLFNSIGAYMTGSADPGLLVVEGKLNEGIRLEDAEAALDEEIQKLIDNGVEEQELMKVKNQAESTVVFGEMELLNRSMNLAYGAVLGDPDLPNRESVRIQAVSTADIGRLVKEILKPENSSVLYYRARKTA